MKTIPAIFENGVFRPKAPVSIPPGAHVELLVAEPGDDPVSVLKKRFPNSFGGLAAADAQEMMKAIEEECERVEPDEWR